MTELLTQCECAVCFPDTETPVVGLFRITRELIPCIDARMSGYTTVPGLKQACVELTSHQTSELFRDAVVSLVIKEKGGLERVWKGLFLAQNNATMVSTGPVEETIGEYNADS